MKKEWRNYLKKVNIHGMNSRFVFLVSQYSVKWLLLYIVFALYLYCYVLHPLQNIADTAVPLPVTPKDMLHNYKHITTANWINVYWIDIVFKKGLNKCYLQSPRVRRNKYRSLNIYSMTIGAKTLQSLNIILAPSCLIIVISLWYLPRSNLLHIITLCFLLW